MSQLWFMTFFKILKILVKEIQASFQTFKKKADNVAQVLCFQKSFRVGLVIREVGAGKRAESKIC